MYNPRLLSKRELVRGFVARGEVLERFMDALRREVDTQPQHHVIVGARGMGKTTLLHRLRFAIEDDASLAERCLGLTFPEEQYNVASLADLWLNCADALADQLQASGESEIADEIDQRIAEIQDETADDDAESAGDGRRDRALALLRSVAGQIGRRLVLLIDNIDLIFDRLDKEQWGLREVLSAEPWIQLIGASSAPLESYYRHDRAFYDFFRVEHLHGLSEDETFAMLRRLARLTASDRVTQIVDDEPSRIRTLHLMAGGNPRTLVVLFGLLSQGIDGDVRTDVERLLDASTPLYKHRIEALSAQAQRVLDGVAMLWFPATAAEVATAVRLDVNKISTHLSRLVKDGTLEKVTLPDTKKHGFQLAERFFNIWYLMRSSRRVRRRLGWFVDFLRLMLSPEELTHRARAHMRGLAPGDPMRHAEMGMAYAGAVDDANLRHALETHSLRGLCADPSHRRQLAEFFDLDGEDSVLRDRAERMRMLAEARETVLGLRLDEPGWDAAECWRTLARSFVLSVPQKHAAARMVEAGLDTATPMLEAFRNAERSWRLMLDAEEFEALGDAVERGDFDLWAPTVEDIVSADEAHPGLSLAACAAALVDFQGFALAFPFDRFDRAVQAGRSPICWIVWGKQAVLNGVPAEDVAEAISAECAGGDWSGAALDRVGDLFTETLGHHEKAEAAYRQAIAHDSANAVPWIGLGNVLSCHLGRYEEAEGAYSEAIVLDSAATVPWCGLGNLLAEHLGRYEEAEVAFLEAIVRDSANPPAWNGLGNVLTDRLGRYEEAEDAYREAIAADSANAIPWTGLGNLLNKLGRYEEAEAAFLEAIVRDSAGPSAWNGLGSVLAEHLGRYEEAEGAFREVIALDSATAIPWNGLGNVLNRAGRYEEAGGAYREAIARDPAISPPHHALAWLLYETGGSLDDAAAEAREAVRLNPTPHAAHTLATILVARGEWEESREWAVRFLPTDATLLPENWSTVLRFFREAVNNGFASVARELLAEVGVREQWEPLDRALELLTRNDLSAIGRLSPEMRTAVRLVLAAIAPDRHVPEA